MDDEVSKAGKDTEKDKGLKWEIPELHDLKSVTATGNCAAGSGDSADCNAGTTASAWCTNGISAVGTCNTGTGGDLPPLPP